MKDLDLTKIFDSMKQNGISELIIKEGKALYEIRRGGFKQNVVAGAGIPAVQNITQPMQVSPGAVQTQSTPVDTSVQANTSESSSPAEKKSGDKDLYELTSPLVGTFYSTPKPGAPAFVEVGDKVKKGQTVCIVEAMKNFNEIESEVDGVIREICVSNEELVEYGKVLFRIELV